MAGMVGQYITITNDKGESSVVSLNRVRQYLALIHESVKADWSNPRIHSARLRRGY